MRQAQNLQPSEVKLILITAAAVILVYNGPKPRTARVQFKNLEDNETF